MITVHTNSQNKYRNDSHVRIFKPAANTAASTHQQRCEQKTDAQLIVMMLVQVGLSSLLIYYAYYVLGPILTGYDKLIDSFLMSFTTLVYYANYTKSFYIYTLSSQHASMILSDSNATNNEGTVGNQNRRAP